jgi:hypothetical protein
LDAAKSNALGSASEAIGDHGLAAIVKARTFQSGAPLQPLHIAHSMDSP